MTEFAFQRERNPDNTVLQFNHLGIPLKASEQHHLYRDFLCGFVLLLLTSFSLVLLMYDDLFKVLERKPCFVPMRAYGSLIEK